MRTTTVGVVEALGTVKPVMVVMVTTVGVQIAPPCHGLRLLEPGVLVLARGEEHARQEAPCFPEKPHNAVGRGGRCTQ
ncbi:hypothetical protein P7K49_027880, partial [Saguinus oedipus]